MEMRHQTMAMVMGMRHLTTVMVMGTRHLMMAMVTGMRHLTMVMVMEMGHLTTAMVMRMAMVMMELAVMNGALKSLNYLLESEIMPATSLLEYRRSETATGGEPCEHKVYSGGANSRSELENAPKVEFVNRILSSAAYYGRKPLLLETT